MVNKAAAAAAAAAEAATHLQSPFFLTLSHVFFPFLHQPAENGIFFLTITIKTCANF